MSPVTKRLLLGAIVVAGVGLALWIRSARQDASAAAMTANPTATATPGRSSAEPSPATASPGADAGQCAPGAECGTSREPTPAAPTAAATPAPRPPRLVDLGTETCKPCKAMLKVLDQLHTRFPASTLRADFINVHTQREEAQRFGVRIIPTQVFLSADGKELFRHVGFISADNIVKKWAELGYPLKARDDASGGPASGRRGDRHDS